MENLHAPLNNNRPLKKVISVFYCSLLYIVNKIAGENLTGYSIKKTDLPSGCYLIFCQNTLYDLHHLFTFICYLVFRPE